ncbi:MAG: phosphoribosylformylglycinamidine cyclo-ligase [bacterium]|nr:phosphoribosylformylglycinamidine cyclo-ligase [bacterium]
MGITYKDSGVDVEGGNSFVKKISPIVKSTFSDRVITGIGGFGALFSGSFPEYKDPVLVSGTDGVGTKLQIAQKLDIHDTIGIDAVAMCVNDIIVSGAKPLFFLDYISCGKLKENVMVDVVKGIAEGCKRSGCSLIGGETAEHPNVMPEDDYDIAGFAVGIVDREKIIDGSSIQPGDKIIGLASSGIHSNGYSLIRKLFFDVKGYGLEKEVPGSGESLGKILLEPTKLYVKSVLDCLEAGISLKGIVHVTGGGFYENIPRILPEKTAVNIQKSSFEILPIYKFIQEEGEISEKEMFTTFNMSIGMIFFVSPEEEKKTLEAIKSAGDRAFSIGTVEEFTDEKVKINS